MSKSIAIVILNWNGRKMLEKFLPSVTAHLPQEARVIVADNGSSDDSLVFLSNHYPSIQVIAHNKNYGFAEGYNKALQQIEADYFVLLNDDVEVSKGWIENVIAEMEKDPQIAIAQPKLRMYDQQDTFEYAGGSGGYIDKYGYPFCRGRIFNTLERDEGQYDSLQEIFWASGAAMFVKSSVWRELGGLDGDFFAHMEEIDFCWRAKNRGYKVICVPNAVVYHVGGGTLPKSSPFKTQLNFRNNLSMLYKNLPNNRVHTVIALRFMLDFVAALSFLLGGRKGECKAVFVAHKEYRERKKKLKEKRAQVNPQKQKDMYDRSLLVEYYIKGHKKFNQLGIQ